MGDGRGLGWFPKPPEDESEKTTKPGLPTLISNHRRKKSFRSSCEDKPPDQAGLTERSVESRTMLTHTAALSLSISSFPPTNDRDREKLASPLLIETRVVR